MRPLRPHESFQNMQMTRLSLKTARDHNNLPSPPCLLLAEKLNVAPQAVPTVSLLHAPPDAAAQSRAQQVADQHSNRDPWATDHAFTARNLPPRRYQSWSRR